jgi:hypothetical protein
MKIENKAFVYEMRNTVTNKVYIGVTENLKRRLNDWRSIIKSSKLSPNAIQNMKNDFKHHADIKGVSVLEITKFDVLELCDIETMYDRELHHILNAVNSITGAYNTNYGAEGTNGKRNTRIWQKEKKAKALKPVIKEDLYMLVPIKTTEKICTTYEAFNMRTGEYHLVDAKTRVTYPRGSTKNFHKKMGARLFKKEKLDSIEAIRS